MRRVLFCLFFIVLCCQSCTTPTTKFIKNNFANRKIVYDGYFGQPGDKMDIIHMELSSDIDLQMRGFYTKNNGPRYGLMGKIEKKRREYILYLNELNNSLESTGAQFVISDFRYGEVNGKYWGPVLKTPHEHAWERISWDANGNKQIMYQQIRDVHLKEPPVVF